MNGQYSPNEEKILENIRGALSGEEVTDTPVPTSDDEKHLDDILKAAQGEEPLYNLPANWNHQKRLIAIKEAIQEGGGGSVPELTDFIEGDVLSVTNDAQTIRRFAFGECSSLSFASFSLCTSIGTSAFYGCSSLSDISFPMCDSIGDYAFAGCTNLSLASFPLCTKINPHAFGGCYNISVASFPLCTHIGQYAFQECSALSMVSFPVCTTIYNNAFTTCRNLKSVNFPSCTSISNNAFYSCTNLSTASFPLCEVIGSSVFQGCTQLKSLYLLGSSVVTLQNKNAFGNTPMSGTTASGVIYIPSSLYDSYLSATNWSIYASRFVSV